MVLRHKWMKLTQNKDDAFTVFMTREKGSRRAADVANINTDQLVAHVILAGCHNQELLKKLLEIPEDELHEQKIKEVADKFEVLKTTTKGLNKDNEDKVSGGGRVQQIKGKEGYRCFKCQKEGHMSDKCKTPRAQLKCSHCKTTGRHNTIDFCKEKQQEKLIAEAEKDTAKANKVEGRDDLPTGDKEKEGKANRVRAVEEEEDTDSNEDGQEPFANQCLAEEDHNCSARESLKPALATGVDPGRVSAGDP